jgi:hypothetical protein
MFDFDTMMKFGTDLQIDLLDNIRPCAFVSGSSLERLEPLRVHFPLETCSHVQMTVTAQTQYVSVIITLLISIANERRLRHCCVVSSPG